LDAVAHTGYQDISEFPLDSRADEVPVQYTPDEWFDLVVFMQPHTEDPNGTLAAWSKHFVAGNQDETLDVLQRMMDAINTSLSYQARDAEGTQAPQELMYKRQPNVGRGVWGVDAKRLLCVWAKCSAIFQNWY
jgi:hypothetical protein